MDANSISRRLSIPAATAGFCVLAACPSDAAAARSFTVHELDLGGSQTVVQAIDDGRAAGWGTWPPGVSPEEEEVHAFTWTATGGIVDIGTLGGRNARALAVDGDRVVGFSTLEGEAVTHAFSWTPTGGLRDIGTLGGTFSLASGVSGDVVVGQSRTASGRSRAFRWTPAGVREDLGTLQGGTDSSASAVDESLIAGSSTVETEDHLRPVAWTAEGDIIDIVTDVELRVIGLSRDVRDGVVVGNYSIVGSSRRAFAWTLTGGRVDLPVPDPFDGSFAAATSEGQVVGSLIGGGLFGDQVRAFSWTREGGLIEIETPGGIAQATHVNEGKVLGLFHADPNRDPDSDFGNVRTFLWTEDEGLVDVTPAGFFGARPAGIDADGRIALREDSDFAEGASTRSAVLVPGPPDADGDGIPDADDDCPRSDRTSTVVIGDCDSGVPNRLLPGGCTIADRIEECVGSASDHRRFVKCIGRILKDLKRARLITGPQAKAIHRCAVKA